jgi:hypothetical protein
MRRWVLVLLLATEVAHADPRDTARPQDPSARVLYWLAGSFALLTVAAGITALYGWSRESELSANAHDQLAGLASSAAAIGAYVDDRGVTNFGPQWVSTNSSFFSSPTCTVPPHGPLPVDAAVFSSTCNDRTAWLNRSITFGISAGALAVATTVVLIYAARGRPRPPVALAPMLGREQVGLSLTLDWF